MAIAGTLQAKLYDRDGNSMWVETGILSINRKSGSLTCASTVIRGEFAKGDMYLRDLKNTV